MQKILVPTDFSPASDDALNLATQIAGKTGAEIFLVNFIDHPFDESFTSTGDLNAKFDDEETIFTLQLIRANTQHLQNQANKYTEKATIHYQVHGEDLVKGIQNYVNERVIDLIVMGTTGEETATEFFTGNHTEQVMEGVNIPVLSLRRGQQNVDFSNIVLGIELEEDDKDNFRAATNYIKEFASALDATLHLVHVDKSSKDREVAKKESLTTFAEKFGLMNYTVNYVHSNDIEAGLMQFSHQNNAGIIAVFSHAEGGFFRIFTSSVSEDLSKESSVPILSINLHNV